MIHVCISSVTSEREFNPDIHCGVVDVTARKPCTRSLTCKVSNLSALIYDRDKTVPAYNTLVTRSRYSTFNYIVLIRIPSVCVSGYELGESEAERGYTCRFTLERFTPNSVLPWCVPDMRNSFLFNWFCSHSQR